jgi:hypothetical protein
MKNSDYPMSPVARLRTAQRCGAHTRSGGVCQQPAMKNGRCRLHGGKSLSGKAHGRYKHGQWTKEAIAWRRQFAALVREAKQILRT